MNRRQKILLGTGAFALLVLLGVIVFGENGYVELGRLRKQRDGLSQKNEALVRKNLELHRRIERLENDMGYIETIARQELGMIARDEVVVKFKSRLEPGPKTPAEDDAGGDSRKP